MGCLLEIVSRGFRGFVSIENDCCGKEPRFANLHDYWFKRVIFELDSAHVCGSRRRFFRLQRLQVALNDVRRNGKMLELDMERKWNQRKRRSAKVRKKKATTIAVLDVFLIKRKEIDIVETRIRMLKDQTDRLAISLRSGEKKTPQGVSQLYYCISV